MTKKRRKTERRSGEAEDYFGFLEEESAPLPHQRRKYLRMHEWPEEAPILTADDICYNFTTDSGRRDLMEWLEAAFAPRHDRDGVTLVGYWRSKPFRRATKMVQRVLAEYTGRERCDLWFFCEKSYRDQLPGYRWIAAVWNEAMSRLGYDIPEKQRRVSEEGRMWGVKCVDPRKERKPRQGPRCLDDRPVRRKQPVHRHGKH